MMLEKKPNFWPDCKSNSGLWIDMSVYPSVCLSVCLSVRPSVWPSVRPSVCPSTFWLNSAFKFVLGQINQYRLDTLHGNRPWWDLFNCDLSLQPWPWLFLFKVTLHFWLTFAFKFVLGYIYQYRLDTLHVYRPWWDLLNCDLSPRPWPWLFLFKVT